MRLRGRKTLLLLLLLASRAVAIAAISTGFATGTFAATIVPGGGTLDAGSTGAGELDPGSRDSGQAVSGQLEPGTTDAGQEDRRFRVGCDCSSGSGALVLFALGGFLLRRRGSIILRP